MDVGCTPKPMGTPRLGRRRNRSQGFRFRFGSSAETTMGAPLCMKHRAVLNGRTRNPARDAGKDAFSGRFARRLLAPGESGWRIQCGPPPGWTSTSGGSPGIRTCTLAFVSRTATGWLVYEEFNKVYELDEWLRIVRTIGR